MSAARTNARAAAVALFKAYRDDANIGAIVYPGRPATIHPPQGFVDGITETAVYPAGIQPQRTVRVEVVILHGEFDSGDSVANADAFADGFMEWVSDLSNVHAAGANTTIGVIAIDDNPTFVPDWVPANTQKTYFGTRVTLEVYDPG